VQVVWWDIGGTVNTGKLLQFCMCKKKTIMKNRDFWHYRIVSAVKRLRLLAIGCHIDMRGCWCNIIVLNVQETNKVNEVKKQFLQGSRAGF
jgi:hypothetical protein